MEEMSLLEFIIHKEEQKKELSHMMGKHKEVLKVAQVGEEQYRESQGWLSVEEWANDEIITEVEQLAKKVQREADVFVLIGVGGSNNAARSVIEGLQKEGGTKILYAGNTLSPHSINEILQKLEGKSVYINCIAKNFETLEPGSTFRILRKYLYNRYKENANERIIVTGTKGSTLEKLAVDNCYAFLEFPQNVGGRYTAVTTVGLLPMAVAGIDIRLLVQGAKDMEKRVRIEGIDSNIAYQYACMRNMLYEKNYRIEMLSSFEPRFRWFYKWWIQLFAESEGKENKGIFPVSSEYSEELHSVGQFVQEGHPIIFETFLNVKNQQDSLIVESDDKLDYFDYLDNKDFWEINQIAYESTVKAHSDRLPCFTLWIDNFDEYHFGQLFYFFEFACYLSCKIMGVNAFDQQGVEAYKQCMFQALGK